MKKNSAGKRGPDPPAQTKRSGWIRKFCGRGLFREIWKNRFVILRGDQLFICSKEVKDPGRGDEVLELLDFDRCEELRKNRSRSKKSHSKFRLLRSSAAGASSAPRNTSLLFLALSPEEKESWIQVLNAALSRAKNRVLDQVTVDDSQLFHPTRDRAKIPHTRRPPTRGHLLAVAAASSDGALTLDLIHEEEPRPRTNTGSSRKPHTLPRQVAPGGRSSVSEKSASLDQIHRASSHGSDSESLIRLQRLIQDKIQLTERLLEGLGAGQGAEPGAAPDSDSKLDTSENPEPTWDTSGDPEPTRDTSGDLEPTRDTSGDLEPTRDQEAEHQETRRLLLEAKAQWNQALQVLTEVQELKQLFLQLNKRGGAKPS